MEDYNFKTHPYGHQLDSFERSKDPEYFGLLMDMGTGKTKVTLDNLSYLYEKGEIDSAFILAPKGMYHQWAQDSHERETGEYREREWDIHAWDTAQEDGWIYVWDNSESQASKKKRDWILNKDNALSILIMNTEAMSTLKGQKFAEKFVRAHPKCLMVVDEASLIKNHKAKRTRSIKAVGGLAKYRRVLTGTPITQGPLDLFGIMSFLSPRIFGNSFYTFRARYAHLKDQQMSGRTFKIVVGYQRLEELKGRIAPFTVRWAKEDCLDLPDKIYLKYEVPLGPDQKRLYDQMREYSVLTLGDEAVVTAPEVITQMIKLRQILCGYVKLEDQEEPIRIQDSKRYEILEGIVDELSGKVVIWCPFRAAVKEVAEGLRKKYGKDSVIVYMGGTENRSELQDQFNDPESPQRFFVGTPQTGKYGLNFTCCNYIIRYGLDFDLDVVLQSEDRIHGIGRGKTVKDEKTGDLVKLNPVYIDLVSPGTMDEKVRESLMKKKKIADIVTGDGWRTFLDV